MLIIRSCYSNSAPACWREMAMISSTAVAVIYSRRPGTQWWAVAFYVIHTSCDNIILGYMCICGTHNSSQPKTGTLVRMCYGSIDVFIRVTFWKRISPYLLYEIVLSQLYVFWCSQMEARPCNSKDSLCIVMFGERSPNIMYSDVWWPFTKHHYTQWILWFWGSESKDSLCIVMFGERSPNIMYSDVWWAFTKHHYT